MLLFNQQIVFAVDADNGFAGAVAGHFPKKQVDVEFSRLRIIDDGIGFRTAVTDAPVKIGVEQDFFLSVVVGVEVEQFVAGGQPVETAEGKVPSVAGGGETLPENGAFGRVGKDVTV